MAQLHEIILLEKEEEARTGSGVTASGSRWILFLPEGETGTGFLIKDFHYVMPQTSRNCLPSTYKDFSAAILGSEQRVICFSTIFLISSINHFLTGEKISLCAISKVCQSCQTWHECRRGTKGTGGGSKRERGGGGNVQIERKVAWSKRSNSFDLKRRWYIYIYVYLEREGERGGRSEVKVSAG